MRMIKRKTRESVVDAVVEYYSREPDKMWTFKDAYFQWRSKWDKTVSDNSVYKYETDYNRFFKDSDFINLPIKEITEEDIIVFMSQAVRKHDLIKTACKRLYRIK